MSCPVAQRQAGVVVGPHSRWCVSGGPADGAVTNLFHLLFKNGIKVGVFVKSSHLWCFGDL